MRRAVAVLTCGLFALTACEKERQKPPVHESAPKAESVGWEPPAKIPALLSDDIPTHELSLTEPRRHPDCWEFLQPTGEPLKSLPLDDARWSEKLASCQLEAAQLLDDGTRIYAWGGQTEEGTRARDLIVGVWEPDGTLRWTHSLNRSHEAANWVANFRQSFVAVVPDRHVCYGTLWEGDTQAACVDWKTGKQQWNGKLPFWSGMPPQGVSDGIVVADLTSMTKRYPFSGEEMRHRKLEGLGGRAGYYASDGRRLYFAASRSETPPLVAYDFDTFDEVWRTPLPQSPESAPSLAYDDLDRLLLKLDTRLYALDTETGTVAWAYDVGDDVPSITVHDGSIYILSRLAKESNQLVKIDPETGDRRWRASTPTGTLRVLSLEGDLFLGSVRAVQRVTGPAPDAAAEGGDVGE